MGKSGEADPKEIYRDQIKLENDPVTDEQKENNAATLIGGAKAGLGEALGGLLGSLGGDEEKEGEK